MFENARLLIANASGEVNEREKEQNENAMGDIFAFDEQRLLELADVDLSFPAVCQLTWHK